MLSCSRFLRLHGFQGLTGKRTAKSAKTKTITLEDPQLKFVGKESADSPTFEWQFMKVTNYLITTLQCLIKNRKNPQNQSWPCEAGHNLYKRTW